MIGFRDISVLHNATHSIGGISRVKLPELGVDQLIPSDSEINSVKLYLHSSIRLHSLELN